MCSQMQGTGDEQYKPADLRRNQGDCWLHPGLNYSSPKEIVEMESLFSFAPDTAAFLTLPETQWNKL